MNTYVTRIHFEPMVSKTRGAQDARIHFAGGKTGGAICAFIHKKTNISNMYDVNNQPRGVWMRLL